MANGTTSSSRTHPRIERLIPDRPKSTKVEKKAREAEQAVDGTEGKELARAEAASKSHSALDDRPKGQSPLGRSNNEIRTLFGFLACQFPF
jgi:hypothetical protein